jgi:hypothetical protein
MNDQQMNGQKINDQEIINLAAKYGCRITLWEPGTPIWKAWADRVADLAAAEQRGPKRLARAIREANTYA